MTIGNDGLCGDMTLLDYFAARALPAVIAMPNEEWPFDFSDTYGDDTCHSDHVAMAAYTYAEAMLRARNHRYFSEIKKSGCASDILQCVYS